MSKEYERGALESNYNNRVHVMCDCDCASVCPQGRKGFEHKCVIWLESEHLARPSHEQEKLLELVRKREWAGIEYSALKMYFKDTPGAIETSAGGEFSDYLDDKLDEMSKLDQEIRKLLMEMAK